jgi:hypothetical protein
LALDGNAEPICLQEGDFFALPHGRAFILAMFTPTENSATCRDRAD